MDVVCYYADLGRPYGPLIERMVQSAKQAMPGCRTVLLTPFAPYAITSLFDVWVELGHPADTTNLCLERARAMVSWAVVMERRAIFCDPDIEFLKPPPFDGSFDVGLLWRRTKADQPVNTGVILAEPGQEAFWKHYGNVAVHLPSTVHGWFCDQLAFALLTGVCRNTDDRLDIDGSRVWLMDAKRHCYKPGTVTDEAWAIHYKGATKGDGWERIFAKSGDGKSLPASA